MEKANRGWEKGGAPQLARRIFLAVFAAVFALLFIGVLFANPHYTYHPAAVLGLAVLWGGLFYGLHWLCRRWGAALEKWERLALPVAFVVIIATQVLFYWQLAAWPTRDFERVFTGAVNFTVNGFIEEPYLDYFYKFPNNMPLTIVLQFVFRAFHRVGFSNFHLIGGAIGVVCALANYLFTYLCCRRLFGVGRAFFALGLLWLCLPLQSYISIFYTDLFTLPFVTGGYYLYLRLLDAHTWKGRLLAGGLLGLVLGFGTKIKYSVALVLIAIAIDLLLRKNWRALASAAGGFLAFFMLFSMAFDSYMYAHFLDKEIAKDKSTPFSAWIMMGLAGDGSHNPADNYIIWDEPTAEGKRAKAGEVIRERLQAHNPVTFVAFLYQKGLRSFGSGNLDYPSIVADAPVRQTFLVECISENGRYFTVFDHIVQGYHVALFALMIAGRC